MYKTIILTAVFLGIVNSATAQWPLIEDGLFLNPSDPSRPYSQVNLTGELFDMVEGDLWQYSFSGAVAFSRHRSQLSLSVPFVRSVYPGIENLSGLGDISAGYALVFHERKSISSSLINATGSLKVSFPTGNKYEGHGVGRFLLIPCMTLAFKPSGQIGIYPSLRYIISDKPASGSPAGGFPGAIPGDSGADPNRRINVLQMDGVFNVELSYLWIGLTPIYTLDLNENESTINLRPELGKLFGESFLIRINSTLYVAGKRRLLSWTQFSLAYYF